MVAILERNEINHERVNGLQSKLNFVMVSPESKKPPASTGGSNEKSSGLPSKLNGNSTPPIIDDVPILYKKEGTQMSKIPYLFETPVPKYFRDVGWFKNENTFKFVTWAFSRCSTQSRKIVINGKEFILQPYEFIAGRLSSPNECFLTENKFRNQLISMQKAGLLKKSTNKITNHFTCYIWVTEAFSEIDNQQNNQPTTNRPPTDHHNPEDKKNRSKEEDHPSIPSFEKKGRDGLNDDLFSKDEKMVLVYQDQENGQVFLSEKDLKLCIEVKGSLENVKDSIEKIQKNPGRKKTITNWVSTLKTWKFSNKVHVSIEQNEALGKKIEEIYGQSPGWRAYHYRDTMKDDRGILFECQGVMAETIFVSYADSQFKEKCSKIISEKKMTKKGQK
jgi:hypothetical protein